MFVQVIHGRTSNPTGLREAMDRWQRDLAPGAVGFLGSTSGVTQDGRFITLARFESEEAAQRNSSRPEQDAWWTETSRLFDGEVTFHDGTRADVDVVGDPDRAGFIQVIQGRSTDPERVRALMRENPDAMAAQRPDVLGSVTVEYDDNAYTTAIYFTSEEEARAGERKEMPPELQGQMAEMQKLNVGEPEFFDIPQPWLYSAR